VQNSDNIYRDKGEVLPQSYNRKYLVSKIEEGYTFLDFRVHFLLERFDLI